MGGERSSDSLAHNTTPASALDSIYNRRQHLLSEFVQRHMIASLFEILLSDMEKKFSDLPDQFCRIFFYRYKPPCDFPLKKNRKKELRKNKIYKPLVI